MSIRCILISFVVAAVSVFAMSTPVTSAHAGAAGSDSGARPGEGTEVRIDYHTKRVSQHKSVYIRGGITPGRQIKLRLQIRYAGSKRWKTDSTTRTGKRGQFEFNDDVTSPRSRSYRVRTVIRRGPGSAVSKAMRVRVKALQDLVKVASSGGGFVPTDGIQIPSENYELGGTQLISDPDVNSGHNTFRLRGRCTHLKFAPGSASESADGSQATLRVSFDGREVLNQTYAPGGGPHNYYLQVFKVHKVRRVRFDYTTSNPNTEPGEPNGVYVGFAYATLGCLPALPRR